MRRKRNRPTHVTEGNVFNDLGFTAEEAAVLRIKTSLHIEIMKVIRRKKITPRELEKLLDVPQPRVSELVNGKISKMTVDRLAKYLHRLGREVSVTTKKTSELHEMEVA